MRQFELLKVLTLNDRVLSRTELSKRVNNSASILKRENEAGQERVTKLLTENRRAVANYVAWRGQTEMSNPFEYHFVLVALAEMTNRGISNNGVLRTWPIKGREYGGECDVSADLILTHLFNLELVDAATARRKAIDYRLALIADVEWQIGIGPLHPFADGCGRTSRNFSAFLSAVYECPLVLHKNRDAYFEHGARGRKEFILYYTNLERVDVSMR